MFKNKSKKANKLSLKNVLFSSVLVDIVMALIIFFGGLAISTNFLNTNKKVDNNTSHIEQLEMRLEKVENEIEELGYFITTSVGQDGQAYIEINGLRDSNGNVVDFDEYVNAEEFQQCLTKIDECLAHQITDYNYVKTLNSSEKVIYSVFDNGVAIDGLVENVETISFLEIPESVNGMQVTAIGAKCFEGALFTAVKLPMSLTIIGSYAFQRCRSLISVGFYSTENSPYISDELVLGNSIFQECSKLDIVSLSDSVKTIPAYTFANCTALSTIKMPNDLLSIEREAFYNCSDLSVLELPETLTTIGISAFSKCSGIRELTLPKSLTSIGSSAFSGCRSIVELTLPESLTSIGSSAFYGMSGLKTLSIPDSVTNLADNCFYGLSLTSLELPASYSTVDISSFGIPDTCTVTFRET